MTMDKTASGKRPRRAFTALRVRDGEGPLVMAMAALFAVTQVSQGLGANTADALFFVRFGVDSLPLMILVSGPVAMAATGGHLAGLGRWGPRHWLPRILWLLAGAVGVGWLGVMVNLPGVYPGIWLGTQAVMLLSFTVMWNAAGEVCNARQAKRLYPLFATAGIGGGVLGNALTGPLASGLGAEHLLLIEAGILATAAALLTRVVDRHFPRRPANTRGSVLLDLRAGLGIVRRLPLLRLMSWAAAAFSVLFFLVSFPFSRVVADSFTDEVAVASFLGIFSALATGATFLVSLLVTNRVLARIGVVAALLIVVGVYLAGFTGWLVSFSLLTAIWFRGAQWVAVNALGGTAWTSLFNVLTGSARAQAMAFVSGVPTQLGTMLSGAILLVGPALTPGAVTVVGMTLAVITAFLVWKMRPAYTRALMEAISQGKVEVFSTPTPGWKGESLDAESVAALQSAFTDPRPEARVLALRTLARADPLRAASLVTVALADPEPRVRLTALKAGNMLGQGSEHAVALAEDPSPLVRRAAAEILQGDDGWPPQAKEKALSDPDPVVRALAAAAINPEQGRPVISAMLGGDDPDQIVAALTAIDRRAELEVGDLTYLASHGSCRVRAALAPSLSRSDRGRRSLAMLLNDPSPSVRSAAAEVLASHHDLRSVLFDSLNNGSLRASEAALLALARERGEDDERLREWAHLEVERARFLRHHRKALAGGAVSETRRYLVRLLTSRERWLEQRALIALSRADFEPVMSAVRRGIWSADPQVRAQALEALDSMASHTDAAQLIRLLEEDSTEPGADASTSLRALIGDFDEWIRALAIRCLAEDLQASLEHLEAAAAIDPSPLVAAAVSRWSLPPMQETHYLDRIDRVLALQRVPIFSGIDPEDLEHVAAVVTERHYEPGELIYGEGEEGDELLVIVSGQVEIQRPLGTLIRAYGPGEPVGELALLRGQARSANVVAGSTEVTALTLAALEFESILEERPMVAMAMLATLAERLGTQ